MNATRKARVFAREFGFESTLAAMKIPARRKARRVANDAVRRGRFEGIDPRPLTERDVA